MALIYTPGNSWRRMVDTVIHGTWAVAGRARCLLERTGGPATTRLYYRHVLVHLLYHTYSIVSSWYVSVLQFQSFLSYGDSRLIERYEKEISNAIKASKTVFHDGAFKLIQVYLFRSSGQNLSIETTGLLNYRVKIFFKRGFENSARSSIVGWVSTKYLFFNTKRIVIYSIVSVVKLVEGNKTKLLNRDCM